MSDFLPTPPLHLWNANRHRPCCVFRTLFPCSWTGSVLQVSFIMPTASCPHPADICFPLALAESHTCLTSLGGCCWPGCVDRPKNKQLKPNPACLFPRTSGACKRQLCPPGRKQESRVLCACYPSISIRLWIVHLKLPEGCFLSAELVPFKVWISAKMNESF